jgi:hypothetical protein
MPRRKLNFAKSCLRGRPKWAFFSSPLNNRRPIYTLEVRNDFDGIHRTGQLALVALDTVLWVGNNWLVFFFIPAKNIDKASVVTCLASVAHVHIDFDGIHRCLPLLLFRGVSERFALSHDLEGEIGIHLRIFHNPP